MENKVYSLYDMKAKMYTPIFTALNRGVAVRTVMDVLGNRNSQLAKYPGDFELHELCSWDDLTGSFSSQDHSNLGNLTQWVNNDGSREVGN